MNKQIIVTASVLGMLAVITGAFGAHGLKAVLPADQLEVWHTAVQYNFYHVFALLAVGFAAQYLPGNLIHWSGRLFIAGIIFFSGSLYLLSYFIKGRKLSGLRFGPDSYRD